MSSEVKNLEVLHKAIKTHDAECDFPLIEIRMNPFEVTRLDWEEFMNVPIVGDTDIPTGRFRLVCANEPTLAEQQQQEREVIYESH